MVELAAGGHIVLEMDSGRRPDEVMARDGVLLVPEWIMPPDT